MTLSTYQPLQVPPSDTNWPMTLCSLSQPYYPVAHTHSDTALSLLQEEDTSRGLGLGAVQTAADQMATGSREWWLVVWD